jgi:hypothetical protein
VVYVLRTVSPLFLSFVLIFSSIFHLILYFFQSIRSLSLVFLFLMPVNRKHPKKNNLLSIFCFFEQCLCMCAVPVYAMRKRGIN